MYPDFTHGIGQMWTRILQAFYPLRHYQRVTKQWYHRASSRKEPMRNHSCCGFAGAGCLVLLQLNSLYDTNLDYISLQAIELKLDTAVIRPSTP